MTITLLPCLLGGFVAGAAAGWAAGRSRATAAEARRQMLADEARCLQQELRTVRTEAERLRTTLARAEAEAERLERERQADAERHADTLSQLRRDFAARQQEQDDRCRLLLEAQQQRFDEGTQRMTEQLKNATATLLRERQQEFAATGTESIRHIVEPLRDTIGRMKQALADNSLRQTALGSEMKAHIENMMRQSEATRQSAEELARALRHGTKVQGDWGETVLDELLRSQGLTRGVHYDTQTAIRDTDGITVKTDEGSLLRPDVILHLDQRRELIIDSKVSLSAFIDYVNAPDEATRARCLKAHVESLRKHVRELAAKDYSSYIRPPKTRMDYVLMFVPHSGALWTALNARPDLWRKAMEQNVFIADEQTLFAALRIVNMTWTQITQAEQHEKVYKLAEEMLDRVGQFLKRYEGVGRALAGAQKAYDDGLKKLGPGGQSILGTATKLTRLGARASAKNPLPATITDGEDDRDGTEDGGTPPDRLPR